MNRKGIIKNAARAVTVGAELLITVAMMVSFSAMAHADLSVVGSGSIQGVTGRYQLIYDSALNITWLDYSAPLSTWQNQADWASGLIVDFNGRNITGWSLPTTMDNDSSIGWNITSSQLGYLFYTELGNKVMYDANGNYQPHGGLTNTGPFKDLVDYLYWSGTASVSGVWGFDTWNGHQDIFTIGSLGTALAVLPGNIAAEGSMHKYRAQCCPWAEDWNKLGEVVSIK